MGGSDELTNLELLHPNCHRQLQAGKPVLTESTYKGLSGVRGNSHAPFLGGGGAAMCRCYPTNKRQPETVTVSRNITPVPCIQPYTTF